MAFDTGDPAGAAGRLSEAARELAHTTRGLDRPSDSYIVLGNLTSGTRSMQQSIQQLAQWHRTTQPDVHYSGGHDESTTGVLAAATALEEAMELAEELEKALSRAHNANGAIRWFDETGPAKE